MTDLAEIPAKFGVTNVYADLGQIFAQTTVADPRVCAAMMGQLVKGLGADHVVWGTDAVWTGSPQWQIEALRRLEIPEDMQKKYGFKPLGPADGPVKSAILGENNARLYKYERRAALATGYVVPSRASGSPDRRTAPRNSVVDRSEAGAVGKALGSQRLQLNRGGIDRVMLCFTGDGPDRLRGGEQSAEKENYDLALLKPPGTVTTCRSSAGCPRWTQIGLPSVARTGKGREEIEREHAARHATGSRIVCGAHEESTWRF